MDSGAPIGAGRRGFRRRRVWIALLFGLPAAGFLLGNLLLSSPWGCRWIATKIEGRIRLEARVGGASLTPWGGASIRRLELLQPAPLRAGLKEPLLRIDSLRVHPVWPAWLRGRFEIRSVELDTPRLVLPLELVSNIARPAAAVPTAPAVVAATPPPVVVQPAPTPPPALPDAPVPRPARVPRPTGWLHLKNASFAVVHAGSRRTLFEISKTSGAIPISGDAARTVLEIGLISTLGTRTAGDLAPTLEWTPPLLFLKPLDLEIGGYKTIIAAKIGAMGGLPLQIEAQLPRQQPAPLALPHEGRAAAESVAANFRFRGLLLAPGTWQGDLVADAVAPTLKLGSHDAAFDKGGIVTVLRGGVLSCIDARLIGDGLSLLGNATLLADGRCAGAVRLVAPPDAAASIVSRVLPIIQGAPSLTPLSTPQRAAFDLEAAGNLGGLLVRLGREGPVVKFNP